MTSRWWFVTAAGLAMIGGFLSTRGHAEDETEESRKIRLKNVADEEKRGHKPSVVTSSVDYTKTVETKGKDSSSLDKTTAHGESRREFFPDGDTDEQFSTDPNDAMWKSRIGTASYNHTIAEKGIGCANVATSRDIVESGTISCTAHIELEPNPNDKKKPFWRASTGCAGDVPSEDKMVFAKRFADKPGCFPEKQNTKSKVGAHFGGDCTQDNGVIVHKDGGWYASCVISKSTRSTDVSGAVTTTTETTTISVILNGKELKFEATIEPVDTKAYTEWRPTGPVADGSDPKDKDGNSIAVKVVLRDAKTHQPVQQAFSAKYTLVSSKVKGILANYPAQKIASDQEDLYFKKSDNPIATISNSDQSLELATGKGGQPVTIRSRDWGSFGSISASVEVDGRQIAAVTSNKLDALALPKDDNKNHIADDWEAKHGGAGATRTATEDDEAEPAMYNKGDGLALYDEYRGFYLIELFGKKPQRFELDHKKRELVIAVSGDAADREQSYEAANVLAVMEKLKIYVIEDKSYAGPQTGDLDADHPRRINPFTFGDEVKPQALVWIVFDKPARRPQPGTTQVPENLSEEIYASPNEVQAVFISHALSKGEVENLIDGVADPIGPLPQHRYKTAQEYLKKEGISLPQFAVKAKADLPKLQLQLERFSVLHELGHAIGTQHHEFRQVCSDVGCADEAKCQARNCPAFTATSLRKESCSVAFRGKDKLSLAESEPLVKAKKFGGLTFYCYDGQNEHYGGGDPNCPMRYFNVLDGEALAKFLLRRWTPASEGPTSKWHMCSENAPQLRLHQEARDMFKP